MRLPDSIPRGTAAYTSGEPVDPVDGPVDGAHTFLNIARLTAGADIHGVLEAIRTHRTAVTPGSALEVSAGIALGNAVIRDRRAGEWRVFSPDRPELWIDGRGLDVVAVVESIVVDRPSATLGLELVSGW